jgi:hypothetical protein
VVIATDVLDRRRQIDDGVAGPHRRRMVASQLDGRPQTMEAFGLIGPDACLEPPHLGLVIEIHWVAVETEATTDRRERVGDLNGTSRAA